MATSNLPATQLKKRVVEILKDSHKFDIIKEMITLYRDIKKARRRNSNGEETGWTPVMKAKMQRDILFKLMEYAYPKAGTEQQEQSATNIMFEIGMPDFMKKPMTINAQRDPKTGKFIKVAEGK